LLITLLTGVAVDGSITPNGTFLGSLSPRSPFVTSSNSQSASLPSSGLKLESFFGLAVHKIPLLLNESDWNPTVVLNSVDWTLVSPTS
jgi:hypothetical protein